MPDKRIIQVPAIFSGFSSRADGGATMRFATNELGADDFGTLKEMHNTFGWLLFKGNEFTAEDIPDSEAQDESKSPSQRLRAAIFVFWAQRGSVGDFEIFYRRQMDKIIDRIKATLD